MFPYGNRGYFVIDLTVATNVIKYIITYNIKVKIIKKNNYTFKNVKLHTSFLHALLMDKRAN